MSTASDSSVCLVCDDPVLPVEEETTYCGSVHSGECHRKHLRDCEICDEDGSAAAA